MKPPTALGLAVLLALSMVGAAGAVDIGALDTLRAQERSAAIQLDLGPADAAVITSDNVEYIGTIPIDSPGIGGEVVLRPDLVEEGQEAPKFFYATGAKGLSIYDVSTPAAPTLVSITVFPHAQNEDLKVSDDGTRAVISADGAIAVPVMPATTGVHVFDTTDVENPVLLASSNPTVNGSGVGTGRGEHTVACADAACEWIYGSSSGQIYDATKADEGVITNTLVQWNTFADSNAGGRHALNRDPSGLVISDSTPRLVLDPTGRFGAGTGTPGAPEVISIGRPGVDTRLQHNNVRPDSEEWTSRAEGDEVAFAPIDRSGAAANTFTGESEDGINFGTTRPVMRAGEIMIGNTETNLNSGCSTAGGLSSWSMVDWDKGAEMQQLEVFRPLSGTYTDGNPARNGLGCSGHWFTERDGFVTASWYEHGVRFFTVDKTNGAIDQVGFFQPVVTEAGAAYWIDDEYVYSMDYARGLDILKFDKGTDLVPTQAQFDASWLANLDKVGAGAAAERLYCSLAIAD